MTDPLRILHVTEPQWGGVLTLLRHFAAEQVEAGHEVHVLAPPRLPRLAGVHHHEWSLSRGRPASYPPAVRELRRLIAAVQPDVVHLHSFFAGLVGRFPGSGTGRVPVVFQPHAWANDVFEAAPAARFVEVVERAAARRTEVLVANCLDEIAAGRAFGVDLPSHELGVAVDATQYRPPTEAERAEARRSLGLGDERVLLVLGRVTRQKGQDLLVQAWEERPVPGATLVLVGPGDTEPLQALAPREWDRSVRAVGEPPAVLPWLWAADVLVLPSRYETVGLVVAEAMCIGLPVVATAVHGARATIEEPGTLGASDLPPAGAVVPLGDMTALLAEAERRLTDPDLHRRESAAAVRRAGALFVPEQVAQRLEAAYRHAIARRDGHQQRPADDPTSNDPTRVTEEPHT